MLFLFFASSWVGPASAAERERVTAVFSGFFEMVIFADGAAMGKAQLDILRNELDDARGEISSLIGQLEGVREDLANGER